jgi:hypothetical protein
MGASFLGRVRESDACLGGDFHQDGDCCGSGPCRASGRGAVGWVRGGLCPVRCHERRRFEGSDGPDGSSGDDLIQQRLECFRALRQGGVETKAFLRLLLLGLYFGEAVEDLC